jgi:hypothetical protein
MDSLSATLQALEHYPGETKRLFRGISGYAPSFRKTADALGEEAK